MSKSKSNAPIQVVNKKAFFDFQILEKHVAGLVLLGTEVKAIRMGRVNLKDAYCYFKEGALFTSLHIGPYPPATHDQHVPLRPKKLLLHKRELYRLQKKKQEKGCTLVPLELFFTEKGLAKLVIGLAKGRRKYDKRERIKERDLQRRG